MYDIDAGVEHLLQDKKLAPYIRETTLKEVVPTYDAYEGLISAIISQQLSVKAAATIYDRFLGLFSNRYPTASFLLQNNIADLRAVGLSRQKAQYVHNVAAFFQENDLFNHDWASLTDDQIVQLLIQIKGVGRWTVEIMLMFSLGRGDVLPTRDLGIQQAMVHIYRLDGTKKTIIEQMQTTAEGWAPYRTLASRYLWAYKDAN